MENNIERAVELLKASNHATAFTGAGISVESGIPTFRGDNGFWSLYDPMTLDIDFFKNNPLKSWKVIKEIFYDFFDLSKPNDAHNSLAKMEQRDFLKRIITQNIDNLHQEAGSENVVEFHGSSHTLVCLDCKRRFNPSEVNLENLPVRCTACGGLLKPDFIFFGEDIPRQAFLDAIKEAKKSDLMLVIGTSGEVMPASQVPLLAKQSGAKIIEVNTQHSHYTKKITDVFLEGKASEILNLMVSKLQDD